MALLVGNHHDGYCLVTRVTFQFLLSSSVWKRPYSNCVKSLSKPHTCYKPELYSLNCAVKYQAEPDFIRQTNWTERSSVLTHTRAVITENIELCKKQRVRPPLERPKKLTTGLYAQFTLLHNLTLLILYHVSVIPPATHSSPKGSL
jgi:hypothetical protein